MLVGLVTAAVLAVTPAPDAPAGGAATAPRPAAAAKLKVVVMDVRATGAGDPKLVEGLSSLVASEVARRPNLAVIAGADLRTLMGYERQRQLVGCTESSCLAELAGALGAAFLVSTEYSRVGSTGLLSMTLLDSGKAMAMKRLTRRVRSDDALVDETAAAVDELLGALPGAAPAAQPAPVAATSTTPDTAAPARGRGYHEHDGFFAGVHLGYGGLQSKGDQRTISGSSGSVEVALGASITPSLALYVTLFDEVASDSSLKNDSGTSPAVKNLNHSLIAYGIGARYYLVPSNFYVGAALGAGQASLEYEDAGTTIKSSSKYGPVLRLSVGKEWWVSADWGLGIALNVLGGTNESTDALTGATRRSTSGAFNVSFSATYN
jgi:hypothetical protein